MARVLSANVLGVEPSTPSRSFQAIDIYHKEQFHAFVIIRGWPFRANCNEPYRFDCFVAVLLPHRSRVGMSVSLPYSYLRYFFRSSQEAPRRILDLLGRLGCARLIASAKVTEFLGGRPHGSAHLAASNVAGEFPRSWKNAASVFICHLVPNP